MKFIIYATHSERYYPALIESYHKFGAEYVVLGYGERWTDYLQKMKSILNHLKDQCDPQEVICVMDGFDTILVRSPVEMESTFRETHDKLIFSRTEVMRLFYSLHWHNTSFLNAGSYIGYAGNIIYLIETVLETHQSGYFNDQRLFGKWMVKNQDPGYRVDVDNVFFLNVSIHKPNMTIMKRRRPFVIGGPGYANLQPFIDHVGIPFEKLQYQGGQHTLWNRLVQGEFNEECKCILPITITVLLILVTMVLPLLSVYYYISATQ